MCCKHVLFSKQRSFIFVVFLGVGAGLMTTVGYSTFNYYFVKRRIFAMSLVQLLKGIILVGHPISVGFLMNIYGFRGTTAIIAAINANCLIAMFVMHPVEWHYKEIKIRMIENEIRPCKYHELILICRCMCCAVKDMRLLYFFKFHFSDDRKN